MMITLGISCCLVGNEGRDARGGPCIIPGNIPITHGQNSLVSTRE